MGAIWPSTVLALTLVHQAGGADPRGTQMEVDCTDEFLTNVENLSAIGCNSFTTSSPCRLPLRGRVSQQRLACVASIVSLLSVALVLLRCSWYLQADYALAKGARGRSLAAGGTHPCGPGGARESVLFDEAVRHQLDLLKLSDEDAASLNATELHLISQASTLLRSTQRSLSYLENRLRTSGTAAATGGEELASRALIARQHEFDRVKAELESLRERIQLMKWDHRQEAAALMIRAASAAKGVQLTPAAAQALAASDKVLRPRVALRLVPTRKEETQIGWLVEEQVRRLRNCKDDFQKIGSSPERVSRARRIIGEVEDLTKQLRLVGMLHHSQIAHSECAALRLLLNNSLFVADRGYIQDVPQSSQATYEVQTSPTSPPPRLYRRSLLEAITNGRLSPPPEPEKPRRDPQELFAPMDVQPPRAPALLRRTASSPGEGPGRRQLPSPGAWLHHAAPQQLLLPTDMERPAPPTASSRTHLSLDLPSTRQRQRSTLPLSRTGSRQTQGIGDVQPRPRAFSGRFRLTLDDVDGKSSSPPAESTQPLGPVTMQPPLPPTRIHTPRVQFTLAEATDSPLQGPSSGSQKAHAVVQDRHASPGAPGPAAPRDSTRVRRTAAGTTASAQQPVPGPPRPQQSHADSKQSHTETQQAQQDQDAASPPHRASVTLPGSDATSREAPSKESGREPHEEESASQLAATKRQLERMRAQLRRWRMRQLPAAEQGFSRALVQHRGPELRTEPTISKPGHSRWVKIRQWIKERSRTQPASGQKHEIRPTEAQKAEGEPSDTDEGEKESEILEAEEAEDAREGEGEREVEVIARIVMDAFRLTAASAAAEASLKALRNEAYQCRYLMQQVRKRYLGVWLEKVETAAKNIEGLVAAFAEMRESPPTSKDQDRISELSALIDTAACNVKSAGVLYEAVSPVSDVFPSSEDLTKSLERLKRITYEVVRLAMYGVQLHQRLTAARKNDDASRSGTDAGSRRRRRR